MKMSIGDVIDRYTICKLKAERLKIDNSAEIELLKKEIDEYHLVEYYIEKLYRINGQIWDLEADIRRGNEAILGLEEIGRRALKIREYNNQRVECKNDINSKFEEGFIEIKMNHGSQVEPSVVITLTTVPERLINENYDGLKMVIESLCSQNDDDYEVHFNIPLIYHITKEDYVIPKWLDSMKLKYKRLKVFRTEDMGPPTKFVPTIQRIKNPETIIITVDDDMIYHKDMIKEHRKYQKELMDSVICYDGRGAAKLIYEDIRDTWVLCVTHIREVHGIQHYKSASYKLKLFKDSFYDLYFGRTFSDDILLSRYFKDNDIKMYVVPYEPDIPKYETRELWDQHNGVRTFPVLREASSPSETGCNNPEMLKIQPKFYEPTNLGRDSNEPEIYHPSSNSPLYDTDKFSHGYIPIYENEFKDMMDVKNVLEIGVYHGDSLRYFKDYFKDATIHGVDINDLKHIEEDRIKIYRLDQENREELIDFINQMDIEFDIIVDDGGHKMKQQQTSFAILFQKLKSKGLYIIEDLHTSDREPWMEETDEISTLNMLRNIDQNNEVISNHMTEEEKEYIRDNVKSITIWSATNDFDRSVTSLIYKK